MRYKDKIQDRVRDYCKLHFEKFETKDFVLGESPLNRRCHLNAVQKIKEGKATEVYLCVAWDVDDLEPCVHFINKLESGKYQDNTWGWLYERNEYYIIRQVRDEEYNTIWELLNETKKSLTELNSNKILRWIHRIKGEII